MKPVASQAIWLNRLIGDLKGLEMNPVKIFADDNVGSEFIPTSRT